MIVMTSTLHQLRICAILWLSLVLTGCPNRAARAPNPMSYRWPERFAYRIHQTGGSDSGGVEAQDDDRRMLRLQWREERYQVWSDSVVKRRTVNGRPAVPEPIWPEDTLRFLIRLGRFGDLGRPEATCDPVVPACADALRSSLPIQLRRLIPRLPVWEAPRGAAWADTIWFNDIRRSRGARGSVVTSYRSARDTTVGGGAYWVVEWRSVRQSVRRGGGRGGITVDSAATEAGAVLVDKGRLIPVRAVWERVGSVRERGTADLAGSAFEPALQ